MCLTSFHVLGPVTDGFFEVEDQVHGTGHVVLALALAHEVVGAVLLVPVVRDEAVLLRTLQLFLVCCPSCQSEASGWRRRRRRRR